MNEDTGTELAPSERLHAAGLFVIVATGVALVDPVIATLRSLAGVVVLGLAAAVVFAWTAARAESRVEGRGLVLAVLMLLQLGFWLAFTRVEQLVRTVAELGSTSRGCSPTSASGLGRHRVRGGLCLASSKSLSPFDCQLDPTRGRDGGSYAKLAERAG